VHRDYTNDLSKLGGRYFARDVQVLGYGFNRF